MQSRFWLLNHEMPAVHVRVKDLRGMELEYFDVNKK